MLWWKSNNTHSKILVTDGKAYISALESQKLLELRSVQELITKTENELQRLRNYNFPMILLALEKVGNEVARFLDYPETSGMHLLTSHNSKSIMREVMMI